MFAQLRILEDAKALVLVGLKFRGFVYKVMIILWTFFIVETLDTDGMGDADVSYFMHALGDMEGLPPGGGLSSK